MPIRDLTCRGAIGVGLLLIIGGLVFRAPAVSVAGVACWVVAGAIMLGAAGPGRARRRDRGDHGRPAKAKAEDADPLVTRAQRHADERLSADISTDEALSRIVGDAEAAPDRGSTERARA